MMSSGMFVVCRCSVAVPIRTATNVLKCVRWNISVQKRPRKIIFEQSQKTFINLMESDCRVELSFPTRFSSPQLRLTTPARRHFNSTAFSFSSAARSKRSFSSFSRWPKRAYSSANPDYYEKLGVASTATPTEIKHAYYRAAKACHPDLFPDDPKAAAKFRDVNDPFLATHTQQLTLSVSFFHPLLLPRCRKPLRR